MRTLLFGLAWMFVMLAAGYDAYFAWQFRGVFEIWEMNPLACWAARVGGLEVVFVFKLTATIFASGTAAYCHFRRHRLEMPFTLAIFGIYLLLCAHYFLSHLNSLIS